MSSSARSDSEGPSTIHLDVHWSHFLRFPPTNLGLQTPIADEPIGASCTSRFSYSFGSLDEFQRQVRIFIGSLDFPPWIYVSLYDQVSSFVTECVAESPTGRCPSLLLVAEITFVHRVSAEYDPRPLGLIPQRQPAASADENSVPDTTTRGPEVEQRVFTYETVIFRRSAEERGGDEGDRGSFFDEDFFLGIESEEEEDNNAGSEMLEQIKRGKWAIGGEEVTCSVCLDEFSEGQEVMTMACEHTYHEQCLLTWLRRNQTCPLCRRPI